MSEQDNASEYDAMLADLDFAIDEIRDKIENGRIRKPAHDQARISYYRALGYLIRTRADVLETKELEELREEVDRIKEQQEREGSNFQMK